LHAALGSDQAAQAQARAAGGEAVKELTKCQPRLWRELGIGTPSIVVIDTEDGNYYGASEADARIRHFQDEELCAEEAAMTHAQRIAELEPSAKWFGEVMAMLHGDGGHYLAKHGAEKAALDAVDKYHALVAERDAARADAERLRGELLAAASVLETCRYSEQPAAKRARDAARSKP
jgi:hypothetical protein